MVLALHFSAAATDWFPFNTVNHKWNISVNGGYSPSGRVAVYGLGATVRGFHLTIGGFGSTHENDPRLDTWNEDASFMFQFGYQIPVIKSLRVIPVIGVAGVGEVQTDGYDWKLSYDAFGNLTGIDNKVATSIKYKFDYGAHLVFNHRKLIVNLGVTRHSLFGGIGLEF